NYQLPGDTYGRYPVQFLDQIKGAFFAVDGHEGLDKEQIYKDIIQDVGGPDAFADNNYIELPLYVYHDMDSCTAVSLRIWSTLRMLSSEGGRKG
ncbi:MAG: hypothetical protein GXN93_01520, partial [Candidatus Diapherotrites archaeon]|nr:hypothetical protein [Candidatus Diapherotrites archaeon]